jgi:hypothetical protein
MILFFIQAVIKDTARRSTPGGRSLENHSHPLDGDYSG